MVFALRGATTRARVEGKPSIVAWRPFRIAFRRPALTNPPPLLRRGLDARAFRFDLRRADEAALMPDAAPDEETGRATA